MPPPPLVAFDSGHLCERGTDVALYDYADFNETILGNRSVVLCPADAAMPALPRFQARFPVALYRSQQDLADLLAACDFYYVIAAGERPGHELARPRHGRNGVHCVFRADQPHGDVYACISDWVSRHYGVGDVPVVPHIVHLPDIDGDLRQELGIPAGATVFGRHGGLETFNIGFAREIVREIVRARDDAWFVFLNTRPFDQHPRVRWLPANTDPAYKTAFVNTCDAMLHARAEGETFGLAVAEFAIRNKPVISCLESRDLYHVEVLGTRGLYYRTPADLRRILTCFRPVRGDFDGYSARFSPAVVMRTFREVFLSDVPEARERVCSTSPSPAATPS